MGWRRLFRRLGKPADVQTFYDFLKANLPMTPTYGRYDRGGFLPPGISIARNDSGRDEEVRAFLSEVIGYKIGDRIYVPEDVQIIREATT